MRRQNRLGRMVNATASKDSAMRRKSTVVLILSFERRLITAGELRMVWAREFNPLGQRSKTEVQ